MLISDNIASIYVEAILSTKKLEQQLLELEKKKYLVPLTPNEKDIDAFERSLRDRFSRHCVPIRFCVDDSAVNNFQNSVRKMEVGLVIDDRDIVASVKQLKKTIEAQEIRLNLNRRSIEEQVTQAVSNIKPSITFTTNNNQVNVREYEAIGKTIGKTISKSMKGNIFTDLFKVSFGSLFTGAFEDLGKSLTKGFNKSFAESINQGLNLSIGDISLVGEKVGDTIVKAISAKIPDALKEEIQEDINNVLGEDNILIAQKANQFKKTRKEERIVKQAREQINVDQRTEIRTYLQKNAESSVLDTLIQKNAQESFPKVKREQQRE